MITQNNLKRAEAISALQQGEVIVYPTEAVWGIGCDPTNAAAVQILLKIKNRPVDKGLILIAETFSQLLPFVDESKLSEQLKEKILASWPGPVTWLLPARSDTPDWLTGGSELIATRVTDHPTVRAICHEFGGAIVSTSANVTGQATPRLLSEIEQQFQQQVKVYVDEALGQQTQPSKIINALTGQVIRS